MVVLVHTRVLQERRLGKPLSQLTHLGVRAASAQIRHHRVYRQTATLSGDRLVVGSLGQP